MAKTSTSFTIMDYTDSISLITGIDSNLPLTQLYNPNAADGTNKLSPSWASTSLTLTPKVMKAGTATSLVSSMTGVKWYKRTLSDDDWVEVTTDTTEGYEINSTTKVLKISKDKLSDNAWQIDFRFTGTYKDAPTKLDFPVDSVITFSRVANGTSFVVARATPYGGNYFVNGEPETLTIKAELIRGTTTDDSLLSYSWEKSTNGTTWNAVTLSTSDTPSVNSDGNILTIKAKDVDSFCMFHCVITDNDSASPTSGEDFTTEGIAIYDYSDPYQAEIISTAGDKFKKTSSETVSNTILICRVYRSGEEVDAKGENLTYTWTKTDKDGNAATFTPEPVAVADEGIVITKKKAIKVYSTDVTEKATFFCEVS